jgi:hypothetical protein
MAGRRRTNARAELQAWYLAGLAPKLAAAVKAGRVPAANAEELDRRVREFLDLPDDAAAATEEAA